MSSKEKNEYLQKHKSSYGALLKSTLKLCNISDIEIANEINISPEAIRQWRSGRNYPSAPYLEPLYTFLKVQINKKTNPSLTVQIEKEIVERLNECTEALVDINRADIGEALVNALKLCYYGSEHKYINPYVATGKTQVVVFDFDGTLTENCSVAKTTWESIWIELGYDVDCCRTLHKKFDNHEISHEQWCKQTAEKFIAKAMHRKTLDNIANNLTLISDCKETFQRLRASNIKIYIVSGSILYIIQEVLGDCIQYVDAIKANDLLFSNDGLLIDIIGTRYDFEGKAHYIQEIASTLKISTSDILFVGNSFNDRYVHMTGATTLCINPKFTDPSNRNEWDHYILDCFSLKDIMKFVKGINT